MNDSERQVQNRNGYQSASKDESARPGEKKKADDMSAGRPASKKMRTGSVSSGTESDGSNDSNSASHTGLSVDQVNPPLVQDPSMGTTNRGDDRAPEPEMEHGRGESGDVALLGNHSQVSNVGLIGTDDFQDICNKLGPRGREARNIIDGAVEKLNDFSDVVGRTSTVFEVHREMILTQKKVPQKVREGFKKAKEIAEWLPSLQTVTDRRAENHETVCVALFGRTGMGKSLMINSLAKVPYLSRSGVNDTGRPGGLTQTPILIKYGETPKLSIARAPEVLQLISHDDDQNVDDENDISNWESRMHEWAEESLAEELLWESETADAEEAENMFQKLEAANMHPQNVHFVLEWPAPGLEELNINLLDLPGYGDTSHGMDRRQIQTIRSLAMAGVILVASDDARPNETVAADFVKELQKVGWLHNRSILPALGFVLNQNKASATDQRIWEPQNQRGLSEVLQSVGQRAREVFHQLYDIPLDGFTNYLTDRDSVLDMPHPHAEDVQWLSIMTLAIPFRQQDPDDTTENANHAVEFASYVHSLVLDFRLRASVFKVNNLCQDAHQNLKVTTRALRASTLGQGRTDDLRQTVLLLAKLELNEVPEDAKNIRNWRRVKTLIDTYRADMNDLWIRQDVNEALVNDSINTRGDAMQVLVQMYDLSKSFHEELRTLVPRTNPAWKCLFSNETIANSETLRMEWRCFLEAELRNCGERDDSLMQRRFRWWEVLRAADKPFKWIKNLLEANIEGGNYPDQNRLVTEAQRVNFREALGNLCAEIQNLLSEENASQLDDIWRPLHPTEHLVRLTGQNTLRMPYGPFQTMRDARDSRTIDSKDQFLRNAGVMFDGRRVEHHLRERQRSRGKIIDDPISEGKEAQIGAGFTRVDIKIVPNEQILKIESTEKATNRIRQHVCNVKERATSFMENEARMQALFPICLFTDRRPRRNDPNFEPQTHIADVAKFVHLGRASPGQTESQNGLFALFIFHEPFEEGVDAHETAEDSLELAKLKRVIQRELDNIPEEYQAAVKESVIEVVVHGDGLNVGEGNPLGIGRKRSIAQLVMEKWLQVPYYFQVDDDLEFWEYTRNRRTYHHSSCSMGRSLAFMQRVMFCENDLGRDDESRHHRIEGLRLFRGFLERFPDFVEEILNDVNLSRILRQLRQRIRQLCSHHLVENIIESRTVVQPSALLTDLQDVQAIYDHDNLAQHLPNSFGAYVYDMLRENDDDHEGVWFEATTIRDAICGRLQVDDFDRSNFAERIQSFADLLEALLGAERCAQVSLQNINALGDHRWTMGRPNVNSPPGSYLARQSYPTHRVSLRRYQVMMFNTGALRQLLFVDDDALFTNPYPEEQFEDVRAMIIRSRNGSRTDRYKWTNEGRTLAKYGYKYSDSDYTRALLMKGLGGVEVFKFITKNVTNSSGVGRAGSLDNVE